MLAVYVAKFMANIEVDCARLVFKCVDYIGKQHYKVTTEELGGQRIKEISAKQVCLRQLRDANFVRTTNQPFIEVRILILADPHPRPFQVGDKCRMREQKKHVAQKQIQQQNPKRSDKQRKPDNRGKHDRYPEQRLLVLVNQIHGIPSLKCLQSDRRVHSTRLEPAMAEFYCGAPTQQSRDRKS